MLAWLALFTVAWIAWALLCARLARNPRADAVTGILLGLIALYARLWHRMRIEGARNIPRTFDAGPLVVVCNHTAGVDPLLVQTALPFEVRWMMGRDMRWRGLADLWEFARIIDVDRTGRDTRSAREAIRHLKSGGVLGVFPEGKIARPRGSVLPFRPGIGLIVSAAQAPVLPVWIEGTPVAPTAWGSLWRRGHARLRIGPIMTTSDGKAEDVTRRIESWFRDQAAGARRAIKQSA